MLWLRFFAAFHFIHKGVIMKKQRFHLYHIDMKYVRDLARADDKVMSVSPQIGKERRPFVGVVVICNQKKYCIPLTSPKPKHQTMKNDKDFTRMFDKKNKLIGCLNFNNMLPVDDYVLLLVDIKAQKGDSAKEQAYKSLLNDQLDWCNDNFDAVTTKAKKLYKIVTENPDKMKNLTRRCCDFKKLEQVLEKRKK
jgi:protein AbiQ